MLPGAVVLKDATLLRMFADARAVTEGWLAGDNEALVQSRRRSTLTLDFETRTVASGWPALRSGVQLPSRLVWKQARPLEPGASAPDDVRSQPIPVDLLARARSVVRERCVAADVTVTGTRVRTDTGMSPDMGHATRPFVSFVVVEATAAIAALGWSSGTRRSAIHTAYSDVVSSADAFDVTIAPDRRDLIGFDGVSLDVAAGHVTVARGAVISRAATCTATTLFASPAAFLEALIDGP